MSILDKKKLDVNDLRKKLFMTKLEVKKLSSMGHEIGLHSHSHTFKFHSLNYKNEYEEFNKNKFILEKIVKKKIKTASYPFGYQTKNSINILNRLKIKFSFRKNLLLKDNNRINKNYNLLRKDIS